MKELDYFKEIKALLENLGKNNETNIQNVLAEAVSFFTYDRSKLNPKDTDNVCRLVLSNYHKLNAISNSKNIDDFEKLVIVSSFVSQVFNRIIMAVNISSNDYNQKTRIFNSFELNSIKHDFGKILERNIEVILILKNFKVADIVEYHLNKEAQNIFKLAESLDIPIRSRKENLELYLSINLENLSKVDSGKSLTCYRCFDYYPSFPVCSDSNVVHAKKELRDITAWKPFRTKIKKQNELIIANQLLDNELNILQKKRNEAISMLKKEIKQMENEIDKLKPYSQTKKSDFINSEFSNSSVTSLKNLASSRIRKFLDERLKTVDGPFDLYNITLVQSELISIIDRYQKQFKENNINLQLTENQIESMFNEILKEIHEEYFN